MKSLTKIASYDSLNIKCSGPFSKETILKRNDEYSKLSYKEFRKNYRSYIFVPSTIEFKDKIYPIQFNFCTNPFCKWYGLPQYNYENIKNKPSRYKLDRGSEWADAQLTCNNIDDISIQGHCLKNTGNTISNWSVAEEIKRLITINSIVPFTKDYTFHRDTCTDSGTTPFSNKEKFYSRGKSSSNSTKYQCKTCKKITNILPTQRQSFSYHQGRSDITVDFVKELLSRTPVKRACENMKIASSTYYSKLEWVYRKCLEFLDKHERIPFENKSFNEIWLNTDSLVYNLNNVRLKGKGCMKKLGIMEKKPMTYLLASGDMHTGYIFRSDIAYDYLITLEDIEKDTRLYNCDHTYSFLRKNERVKLPFCPQPPVGSDIETEEEYKDELSTFYNRKHYVQGLHIKLQYTAAAHYWLIKKTLKCSTWRFVSDDDATLETSIFRAFSDEVINKNAHYFTCRIDKSLSLEEAGKLFFNSRTALFAWAKTMGYKEKDINCLAVKKLADELQEHNFYEYKAIGNEVALVRGNNPILAPLCSKDEGRRYVNCITDLTYINNQELTELLVQVNSRVTNNFFQELRRRISILERPLTTARGDGKSYIYANYNPKYAQYAVTIFRTFYNFCFETKIADGKTTPAQRLGLTDKVYGIADIVYFK